MLEFQKSLQGYTKKTTKSTSKAKKALVDKCIYLKDGSLRLSTGYPQQLNGSAPDFICVGLSWLPRQGGELIPGSDFKKRTNVQIAARSNEHIKGFSVLRQRRK